jgi:hypothetical protein
MCKTAVTTTTNSTQLCASIVLAGTQQYTESSERQSTQKHYKHIIRSPQPATSVYCAAVGTLLMLELPQANAQMLPNEPKQLQDHDVAAAVPSARLGVLALLLPCRCQRSLTLIS